MPPSLALLCALLATATALDAKWTPNGDGPSRFSKRYRDAAGIDDSRWSKPEPGVRDWLPSGLIPETEVGWIVTIVALLGMYLLLSPQRRFGPVGGQALGAAAAGGQSQSASAGPALPWGRQPAQPAPEAARADREAFLRRFER